MPKSILPTINALFLSADPPRQPVELSWRLVRRNKRPFLLLPEEPSPTAGGMELYSAQRPLAILWRAVIPKVLKTPAAAFFRRVSIRADASSEWMQFLGEQTNQSPDRLRAPAIMFSGVSERSQRLVLLLPDAGGYPVRVIKVGLDPRGRAATDREADLLSRLPANVIGCTGITGRFSSSTASAFATAFFSGKSLATDVGIEKLFHAWLNPTPPEPIEHLASWAELEAASSRITEPQWPLIRGALVGQAVRSTLFHGDFTPWNVRMTNLENIRAYDWESGHLQGIPAWDWFHFVVQTSILAKRHSPERVVAELEQLVRSPRFQEYASDASISHLVEPLLLAYLLHKEYVVRPLKGSRFANRLFDLLWTHWKWERRAHGHTEFVSLTKPKPSAAQQLKSAVEHLANLFWEPTLSPDIEPPIVSDLATHWKALAASLLWIGGVATLPFLINPHMIFTPFHLLPCVLLALNGDRRLASLVAYMTAIGVPALVYCFGPGLFPLHVICWNIIMRMIVFKLIVLLLANVRKQRLRPLLRTAASEPNAIQAIAGSWAVIAIACVFLGAVATIDAFTNPNLIFLPLYLLPCVTLTLAMNWRWGTMTAVLAALGPLLPLTIPDHEPLGVEVWNTGARFVIFETVVLLLERVRRQNILFCAKANRSEDLSESCED